MKKQLLISLLTTVVILTSCGKQIDNEVSNQIDPVSQKVMDDINSIGEVSLENEELINKILETYKTLTDNQKNKLQIILFY